MPGLKVILSFATISGLLLSAENLFSQILVPDATPVTQIFDGMGAALNLPSNWRIHKSATPTWAAGSVTVTQQSSSGSPTTGGSYNWGSTAGERAAGVMSSGSYISPSSLMAWYQNTNASSISQLNISYDVERYRINTASAQVDFFYSLDGSTWISVTQGDVPASSLPTGASAYNFNPPQLTINVGSFNITSLNILNGESFYLRWNLNTTGTNSQGIGIDNVSVTATFSVPSPDISVSPSTISGFTYVSGNGPSASQSYNLSGTTLTPASGNITVTGSADYEVSSDNSTFSASVNFSYSGGTMPSTPVYIRLISGLPPGSYNGQLITNSGGGAGAESVTCNGTVTASSESDVIAVAGSESASLSSIINTAGPLASAQGTQVWQFIIRDGGGASDADNLPTILTSITIANLNAAGLDWNTSIKSIDLFDNTTNIASVQTGSPQLTSTSVTFSGLNFNVPDNSSKTISVRLSLNCPAGAGNSEGDYFRFSISNINFTTAGAATSSQKSAFAAAQSSGTSPRNQISVVATQLTFTQQPVTTGTNQIMAPSVIVSATDVCGNTDIDFTGNITLSSTGTMTGDPVTVAATSGSAVFSTLIHTVTGTGLTLTATAGGLSSAISNTFDIFLVTTFIAGDMAIVGICVNQGSCGGAVSEDEVSIVSFVDIAPGTSFDITDNGFERVTCGSNNWGNTEGVIRITRNTSIVPAGTIITFRIMNNSIFTCLSPDNNWTVTYPVGSLFNLNNTDEQVYLMQGGTWNAGTLNNHDATYTGGTFMFAINTYTAWTCNDNATTRGNLPLSLRCFSLMPATGTANVKYTGPVTPANKKDWIDRLNSPSNWSASPDCATYNGQSPNYAGGLTFTILAGGFAAGLWTGSADTDWFNCNNWQNYNVPSSTTNVTIPNVVNDPVIGASPALFPNGAETNNITVTADPGILTINNSLSVLSVSGNITLNGNFTHSAGLVKIINGNSALSAVSPPSFYNLTLNKTLSSNSLTLGNDIVVTGTLTLQNGMISTGLNKVNVTNSVTGSVTGFGTGSYVNGNLRRYVNSTGSYDFPVGTSAQYEFSNITLNSSAGISYIDALFTSPHVTSIDISPLGLSISGSAITTLLDYGFWTIAPDFVTSVDYDVTITSRGHTNGGSAASQHTVVKRPESSTGWSVFPANHNNATQSGTGTLPVTAELTNMTAFSDFAIARSALSPLPVELLDFYGKPENSSIVLKWNTVSEYNNDFFEVYKSHDNISFYKVGVVAGAGNTNALKQYSFTDISPFQGLNYYFLRQHDYDGKTADSETIEVEPVKKTGLVVYVNNYNELNVISDQIVETLIITDVTGKTVCSFLNNQEIYPLKLKLPEIRCGLYFVRIYCNGNIISAKVYLY